MSAAEILAYNERERSRKALAGPNPNAAQHRRKYMAKVRATDPEKFKRITTCHRDEQQRANHAAWRRGYRAKNPEKSAEWDACKRARRAGASGSHSKEEWIACLAAHDGRCVYCGSVLTPTTRSRDHVIPLCRGGTNDITNIVPACKKCNSRKHTKTREEYLAWLAAVGSHVAMLPQYPLA